MGRYEIQILDGYNNVTYADGTTAAIYGQYPPLVNVAPRFKGEKLISPTYVTVVHNGVLVHHYGRYGWTCATTRF